MAPPRPESEPFSSEHFYSGRYMIGTQVQTGDSSLVEKGRDLLERGDLSAAMESYSQVYDPETVDEAEARNMLIEARSHLARKHIVEALECFEEALQMGTDVQRRQALDGIAEVGKIRTRLKKLAPEVRRGVAEHFGDKDPRSGGISLISDDENVVLITADAVARLPVRLAKAGFFQKLPPHLVDSELPLKTDRCFPYIDEEDVRHLIEIAAHLAVGPQAEEVP
ncbi:MAG: tetratricopeptide repeat protein [Desulfomonile sp.]|nr:tetratricopeptide repeat protein [Desulfomonile sp.]